MKKILLSILVVIFCFVSVPEFCVGARDKYSEIRNNTTTITTPTITVSDPIAAKKEAVLKNLNNLLQDTKWQENLGEDEINSLLGWNLKLKEIHIHNMIKHSKRNHHILTQEFELPKSENISEDTITLEDSNGSSNVSNLHQYRTLCKEINQLKDERDEITKQINNLQKSLNPTKKDDRLTGLQKLLEDNEGAIRSKEGDMAEIRQMLPKSFNLKTEESKEAFINWAIHKKERPQDRNNNSNRAMITAIDATDRGSDEDAMLNVLLGLESIKEASLYKDGNEDIHLKLVLKVKPQHYFKQIRVGALCRIQNAYSTKMIVVLTKDKTNHVRVSTMYIKG